MVGDLFRETMRFAFCTPFLLLFGCASAPITSDRPLESGDRITVVFTNRKVPEINQVVDAAGKISMPYLGTVQLEGLTLRDAERAIEKMYLPSCFKEPIRVSLSRL